MTSVKSRWPIVLCMCLLCLALAAAGCDLITGPGMLTGTVTYTKDPTGSLQDPQNAGEPASGVKVLIYGTDPRGTSAEGIVVYVEHKEPVMEVVTDEQGRYTAELMSGHYVVRLQPDPQSYHSLADVGPWRTTTVDFIIKRSAGR